MLHEIIIVVLMGFYRYYAIIITDKYKDNCAVAPLVGAWIEINSILKRRRNKRVAPLVGAWIEIAMQMIRIQQLKSRSSCRSVD